MDILEESFGRFQSEGLTGELKDSKYNKVISQLQRFVHAQIPEETYNTAKIATPAHIREEVFEGKNYKRSVIFLMSNGCQWAIKNAHGCTMCGHLAKQTRRDEVIPVDDFIYQLEGEFEKHDFKNYPLLNIYNNGSFLNDNEIPPTARRKILKRVNEIPDIKMLVLETRPEFVTEEKIKEIKQLVPDKHVEIAVGLEIKNDLIRTICLNKGFSLEKYEESAGIIVKHLHMRTYVFLKPPFLSEMESVDHAVETVEYALEKGNTTVSLEACTVQDFTLVKHLYNRGMYTPPWLWSILEVVRRVRIKGPGKLIVGLFQFYPSPRAVPYNCDRCSSQVMEVIKKYNRTLDKDFLNDLDCGCKKDWQAQLKQEQLSFKKKLKEIIQYLKSKVEQENG
jgi:radical SAM enzyme (TIGR01210 family)